jgi:site-specific recombinase XerD
MTDNSLMLVFKYLGQKMNFKDVRVSAHTFRHTFCHRLPMSGMSAFAIQKLMRHRNLFNFHGRTNYLPSSLVKLALWLANGAVNANNF